jgi:hypothetical protein
MNELPYHSNLDIHLLSRCFKNVSNSYKYYWFLSILDHVVENKNPYISYDEISLRMLSSVWYPLDFYKLSFGPQDGFKELASAVSTYIKIDNGTKAKSLFHQIENDLPVEASRKLRNTIKTVLKRWVTYRFLSPFFEDYIKGLPDQKVNGKILQLTNLDTNANFAPYKILSDGILLNSEWTDYFMSNQVVLRGFIKWHLLTFLQKNNPNVIGLSQKLEKPIMRDLKLAKAFWSSFLKHNVANCIYSEIVIPKTGFSLDHFIPWTYVAHDLVWNIIPTTISINSAKSNSLPSLTHYLDAFCDFQYLALTFHVKEGHNKLMEDYFSLFRQANFESLDKNQFCTILKYEISNNYRTAENMGFKSSYIY